MKQLVTLTICLLVILFAAELSVAQKPQLVVQTGHSGVVLSAAFSPDGKLIASGSGDNTIRLWEVATGRVLRTLRATVKSIAFTPDGQTLATASGYPENRITLWDVATGREVRTFNADWVESLAFNANGTLLVSGGITIKLWKVATGRELRTFKGDSKFVYSVAFSSDGKTLASGEDNTINLWEVATGRELLTLTGHSDSVQSLAFSGNGQMLVSGSSDKTIKVWDVPAGRELRTFVGHTDRVSSIAVTPDGKFLASDDEHGSIKLWDVTTGRELRTLNAHSSSEFSFQTSVTFSPDGKVIAGTTGDETIRLWDVATLGALPVLTTHSRAVESMALSANGTIAGANRYPDKTIKLWDVAAGRELRTLMTDSHLFKMVAFSPDGKILASASDDETVKLWEVATGRALRTFAGHSKEIRSIAFSSDGKLLATGSDDWTVKVWEVATAHELRTLKGRSETTLDASPTQIWSHSIPVWAVAFTPDGSLLASADLDGFIKLWDLANGRELNMIRHSDYYVSYLLFTADGKTLASASGDGTIKLWEVATGRLLRTLERHSDAVESIAMSPDGKTLASGGWDMKVKLWDVPTGRELRTLEQHSDRVTSVAFSADGKLILSGSWDATIKLCRVDSGELLASLISFDDTDWMVVTPDGLFDGSPAAWNKILWRFNNNAFNYAPVEAFFGDFYYPGLLTDIFAGKRPVAPSDISEKDRRQPQLKLTLTDAQPNAALTARNVTVKIDVAELAAAKDNKMGSGAQDVRLFRNGSLVKVWRGDVLKRQSSVTLEATIPIVAGENRLTAYAFNHDNIKSSDATFVVKGADSLKRAGTAYILAIGINSYANSQYNLKYARADAQDFAAEVKRQQEMLKRYAHVEIISLTDDEATKANIIQRLKELASRVQPEDVVIVYFAGHGTAHGNQFYLIPHDLGYVGPRTKLNERNLQTILVHSISDRDLEKAFEGIDCGQLLLVIDACNSGQALEAEEKRRGPMNSKGLAQLAYEKGMYVLTAAQSYQAAREAAKFGHGFLTYALVEEGLKQGAADREPKDRTIDLREWLNYAAEEVPRMQEANILDALRGRGRYLNFGGDGSGPKDDKNNVQHPRIFYRRELESNPLVVGIVGTSAPQ